MKSAADVEESFHAGQTRILEMVASDAPLPEVLKSIVLLMEGQCEGMVCSILLLSSDGKHIRHGAAPGLPEDYIRAVDGAPIGPRNGSCGTAMFMRMPIIVSDILNDVRWADYRALAELLGLRACWSTPIVSSSGDVLGSFAIYGKEPRLPRADEKRLPAVATHIAGIAIERQRAQEKLREREARISLAAEAADLSFWGIYPETKTAWMSEKGRAIYGFDANLRLTRELICGRVHPDDRAAVCEAFDRACAEHGAFESQHRLVLPHGRTRWVIARGRCLENEQGAVVELIGVTINVTAQKEGALRLQTQREEMAQLNRVALIGEITASVAHELNQPLTAIANTAAAARRFIDRGEIDPVLFRELVEHLAAESVRAGRIVRGIRAMAHKGKETRCVVDLNAVLTETLQLLSSDIELRKCVVTTELADDLPDVEAVPAQMQQVLLNLIMNALDSLESRFASQRRITLSTRAVDGGAEVSVRDFGAGLPKERPEKVFDHFFSTKPSGMGMGLTIVRSIIESHAGSITAENMRDGGARFFFRLPAAHRNQESQAA